MATSDLESRVSLLETELATLKMKIDGPTNPIRPWWEEVAGAFAEDPDFDEAMRLGRKWRDSSRPIDDDSKKPIDDNT